MEKRAVFKGKSSGKFTKQLDCIFKGKKNVKEYDYV